MNMDGDRYVKMSRRNEGGGNETTRGNETPRSDQIRSEGTANTGRSDVCLSVSPSVLPHVDPSKGWAFHQEHYSDSDSIDRH